VSKIAIIIPCYNEEKYIAECIESILSAELSHEETEVIFVDGESSDGTVEIIKKYISDNPFIQVLHNPKRYTPVSMNMGIRTTSAEYIFILSAHAKYGKSYFSTLLYYIKELKADCVGAILETEVKNKNKKSNAIKAVLQHRFGVGDASFRTGTFAIKEVDTVAFGCYRKASLEKFGLFDERLIRNQDIELNKRIVNGGGKIYLIPDVSCVYYARENFKDLAKNNYANGKWNILTAYYTNSFNALSLRHFVPLLFVLSLIVPLLFSLFLPQIAWLSLLSLVSYLALVIILSFKLRTENRSFIYLLGSFLTLHLSYGIGSLAGIFSVSKKRIKGEK